MVDAVTCCSDIAINLPYGIFVVFFFFSLAVEWSVLCRGRDGQTG